MDNGSPMENIEFLEAYDKYANAIFRHCYYRLYERELAKELMQETFRRTWEQISAGRKIENIQAFLYRVATNLIIDETRKKKQIYSLDELENKGLEPGYDDRKKLERVLDGRILAQLLDQIPENYREAIKMRYFDDFSLTEIADILGESENNISVRISRGLKQLRDLLGPEEFNF